MTVGHLVTYTQLCTLIACYSNKQSKLSHCKNKCVTLNALQITATRNKKHEKRNLTNIINNVIKYKHETQHYIKCIL